MRALASLVLLGSTAVAAPLPTAPPPPADLTIDISKLVLAQPRTPGAKPAHVLCRMGELTDCEQACTAGSAASCFRLGWTYATGGADNPLLVTKKFEQDFVNAEVALAKACKLGFHAACVDVEIMHRNLKKPRDTAQLQASCKAGYGRACSLLADDAKDEKIRDQLYVQGCAAGDGDACISMPLSKDVAPQLERSRAPFVKPAKATVQLACPAGTELRRALSGFDAQWTVYRTTWACGRFDAAKQRFIQDGPYIGFGSEEDESVHPFGVITERGVMVAGKKHGIVEQWNHRGDLTSSRTYKAGREDGTSVELSRGRDGSVESIAVVAYVDGKRQGTYKQLLMPGEPQFTRFQTGEYKDAQKIGTWLEVRVHSKQVFLVEHYVADKLEGERDEFSEKDGSLVGRTTYVANKATKGIRYNAGVPAEETVYINGRKSEVRDLDARGKPNRIVKYGSNGYDRISTKVRTKSGTWIDEDD